MKITVSIILILITIFAVTKALATTQKANVLTASNIKSSNQTIKSIHDLEFTTLLGETIPLSTYKGSVVLIVNTASHCGFTYQYKHLQELYELFKEEPFEVIGFPCNQFGNQEPGSNEDIKEFCDIRYRTTFPMSEKVNVSGNEQSPIYKFLTSPETNPNFSGPINWNFNKFLINQEGHVIARFSSLEKPTSRKIKKLIKTTLAESNKIN
tara:strand:+ start:2053 stop:2682 length:630 start_codon:yes stop_codon:yes gene_type:complete